MRLRFPVAFAAAVAAALVAPALSLKSAQAPVFASEPRSIEPRTLAMIASSPRGATSSLYFVENGDNPATLAPLATFNHAEGAVVRASVLADRDVVAVADTLEIKDLSFAASLFLLRPHAPPVTLCDRVVHASRPLVTADGRVFVSRGDAGIDEPLAGGLRVDSLSIDEIDPSSGQAITLHGSLGYLLFLAGSIDRELFVYRVGPGGADLVAVDRDSGSVRVILPKMPPFARDFSVAGGSIVMTNRDDSSPVWSVLRVDAASGAITKLREGDSMSFAPHALRDGSVAMNTSDPGPLGAGVDLFLADSSDGRALAALHTNPRSLPVPFVVEPATGLAEAYATPAGARVTIAGFVEEAGK